MSWRLLDDPSDVAFEADGASFEELAHSAVDATLAIMVSEPERLEPRVERRVVLRAAQEEGLLFALLAEILYRKDAERLLLRVGSARLTGEPGDLQLDATLAGEPIDARRQELLTDVKAVTLHRWLVEAAGGRWRARAVLDV